MATAETLKRLGMTDSEHRAQFYGVQEERCAVCETHLRYGHGSPCDKTTKTFFCHRCLDAVIRMRKVLPQYRPRVLEWANKRTPNDG